MSVRRRNRIARVAANLIPLAALLFLLWAMWEVERRRNTWLFVAIGAGMIAFIAWTSLGARRDHRRLDRYLEAVGIDPAAITGDPPPLMPPRGQRAALGVAIVFLLLVAAAAVANYLGWLDGFRLPERRR